MLKFISDLFQVSHQAAMWILIGSIVIIALIITLLVILIVKGQQKRKINSKNAELVNPSQSTQNVEEIHEQNESVLEEVEDKEESSKINEEVLEETPQENKDEILDEKKEADEKETNQITEEIQESKTSRIAIGKYEVFPINDFYLYRLKASNGEIMVVSEIYKTSKGAVSAIETVKKNIENGFLQISMDKHGLWQFRLFATNKRLLVESANYSTQQGCESAANSFKKFALISPIVLLDEDTEHLMEEVQLQALSDKKGGKLIISAIEDEFEFKLLASNGVILCTSNTYKTKPAIYNGISVLKEACKKGRFIVVKDKNNMFQFKLYTTLGRCVVIGEAYKNKNQAISAANSVSSFINMAEVVDKSIETDKIEQQ